MSDNIKLLLIGTGYMGKEYCKVLKGQSIPHVAVCRSQESAKKFEDGMGIKTFYGGVKNAIAQLEQVPERAIVAVNVDQLASTVIELIRLGIKRILVEKPAGLNGVEIKNVCDCAKEVDANIYVAYNRRFYASTERALEIIAQDGGVTSFNFEFTEWSFQIEETNHIPVIKEEWMLANSSHVIDLAFFLGGVPKEMSSYKGGSLFWHSRASRYAGAGISETGALFSYQANWDAPGRWAVEILTSEHRLYFKPMEKLSIQNKNSVKVEEVVIDDHLDIEYKPGLYNQIKAFMGEISDARLLKIDKQLLHMQFYEKIEGLI